MNKCYYEDSVKALKTFPNDSIDVALTDPPWCIDFRWENEKKHHNRTLSNLSHKTYYKDDYPLEWNLEWFPELLRICNTVVVATCNQNLNWWIKNTDPIGILITYFKNSPNGSKISKSNCYFPYLVYSKTGKMKNMFKTNVMEYTIMWGFLRDRKYEHPSPKSPDLWERILTDLKPESVIDPFLGSGVCAQACERLGIPWVGFELKEDPYRKDIDFRIQLGKIERKKKLIKQVRLSDLK
jgi:DNA modification methylase